MVGAVGGLDPAKAEGIADFRQGLSPEELQKFADSQVEFGMHIHQLTKAPDINHVDSMVVRQAVTLHFEEQPATLHLNNPLMIRSTVRSMRAPSNAINR